MPWWLIALIAFGVLLLVLLVWLLAAYTGLKRLSASVQESWSELDTALKRRHDLVPTLVETVSSSAAQDPQLSEDAMRARSAAMAVGSRVESSQAESALSEQLERVLAAGGRVMGGDPAFTALVAELGESEQKIASSRRAYNSHARELESKLRSFPARAVAGAAKAERGEPFEMKDTVLPSMQAAAPVPAAPAQAAPVPPAPGVPAAGAPAAPAPGGAGSTSGSSPRPRPGDGPTGSMPPARGPEEGGPVHTPTPGPSTEVSYQHPQRVPCHRHGTLCPTGHPSPKGR